MTPVRAAVAMIARREPTAPYARAFFKLAETATDPSDAARSLVWVVNSHSIFGAESERIRRCLGELEKERAAAVRGAYLDGLSYAELAERHRVPLNTMRTWLRRSLLKLRDCLER